MCCTSFVGVYFYLSVVILRLGVCYVLVWGIFANGSVFLTYYSGVILVPYIYLHIVVELM